MAVRRAKREFKCWFEGDRAESGPITRDTSAAQPNEDQNSATTVTAISTVPAHPKIVSVGRALKRPIAERRVTTTIMTVMIGTATVPCVRSPKATMRND